MEIIENLTLFVKVSLRLRPYLKKLSHDLDYFNLIKITFDSNMELICLEIKKANNPRYTQDIKEYERLSSKAKQRNQEIDLVREVINSDALSDLANNPYSFGKEKLKEYADILSVGNRYQYISPDIKAYIDEFQNALLNYKQICLEYDLHNEYESLLAFKAIKYIDSKEKHEIEKKCKAIISKVNKKDVSYYDFDKHKELNSFIETQNQEFIKSHLKNPLFDNINSHSLDNEQRTAVLTDETSNLVIAGAGSGKTLTICGKVKYLLEVEHIHPKDILLLSYSKKSADDLQTKISKINAGLTVGTFHKIGLDILKETQNKTFTVEDQYKAIIETYFREEIKNRPHMLQKILEYYGLYINDTKFDKKYNSEGELFEDLKKSDFNTLRCQLLELTNDISKRETIKKELVKSYEELAIANWYFINGINYVYEAPYEVDVSTFDKRQYMPDFKLADYPIYHEHYGINKDGKASQFGEKESADYVRGMVWKRTLHKTNNTDCIETYSYEFEDGTVFKKLAMQLKERGVKFKPLSPTEILNALNSIYENRAFKSFINLIRTFLSLYKALYRDDKAFESLKRKEYRNNYQKQRAWLFLDIVKDLYQYYMDYLKAEGKIDFDDMILESTKELDHTNNFKYKYIIVDEFQDISVSRMKFLKRLISQGDSKLFAVGDDWQAIYRFSGCDLNIFIDFKDYFGDSAFTKITTTHRNSQELQDIVGPFIRKNPDQINKNIQSKNHLKNPIRVMYYNDKKYQAFLDILNLISKDNEAASVLILGRNNKDLEDIILDDRIYVDYRNSSETKKAIKCSFYPSMKLSYSTVHGAKGLEDDNVILINADDKIIGFPNKMEDDELLDLVLSHKNNYPFAEERRLWYVALTRTKNYTFVIADANNPSKFLEEMIDQCVILNPNTANDQRLSEISCPRCKTGRLVLRTNDNDGTEFYGCTNYPYCNYTINDKRAVTKNLRCRECGDFMVFRKGKWGAFYGCHNYPRCEHTEEYVPDKQNER